MKIREVIKDNLAGTGFHDKESSHVSNSSAPSFTDQLNRVHNGVVHEKLESLFNDIGKQGRVLGETLNIKDLKKFKDLIQRFLDYAVNKMYRMREQHGWDRKGRHKIYTLVETVNKEMETLTRMVLTDQKEQIGILAKVDEIRGLLLDIYS